MNLEKIGMFLLYFVIFALLMVPFVETYLKKDIPNYSYFSVSATLTVE